MPLIKGKSNKSRQKNIDRLIHKEHKTPSQAMAIAYSIQKEAIAKSRKKKK